MHYGLPVDSLQHCGTFCSPSTPLLLAQCLQGGHRDLFTGLCAASHAALHRCPAPPWGRLDVTSARPAWVIPAWESLRKKQGTMDREGGSGGQEPEVPENPQCSLVCGMYGGCHSWTLISLLRQHPWSRSCPKCNGALGGNEGSQLRATSAGASPPQAAEISKGCCCYCYEMIISISNKICFYVCIKYT